MVSCDGGESNEERYQAACMQSRLQVSCDVTEASDVVGQSVSQSVSQIIAR